MKTIIFLFIVIFTAAWIFDSVFYVRVMSEGYWLEISDRLQQARAHVEEGKLDEAEVMFNSILKINPQYANAWYELSLIAKKRQDFEAVIHCLKQAYECNPENPNRSLYLEQAADLYRDRYELEKAIECYKCVIEENPDIDLEHVYNNYGLILIKQGRYDEASEIYIKLFESNPSSEVSYNNYATVLKGLGRLEDSIKMYRAALEINPFYTKARNNLARTLGLKGAYEEAQEEYRKGVEHDPMDVTALWGEMLFLPIVYDTQEQIEEVRKKWMKNVQELIDRIPLNTEEEISKAIETVQFHVNFLLPYQGGNLIEEQKLYGALVDKIVHAAFPKYTQPIPKRKIMPGEKIRVGFVSAFFFHHSVYKTHGHWITRLNRDKFETHTFYLNDRIDAASYFIKRGSDSFYHNSYDYVRVVQMMLQKKLDVIIYLDIGMVPNAQLMGAMRLAPIQCMTHGHPFTTGLSTMDYFLSSALMEPEGGADQYIENLYLLPNLGSSYPYPFLGDMETPKSCENKDPSKVHYANVQSIFKLLPKYDYIYPRIVQKVPNAQFHFIASSKMEAFERFHKRLKRAFEQYGMNVDDYCRFHPNLSQNQFLGLLRFADVYLDSIEWQGFNSSMEALACDKPIVSLPTPTCRGRHTYAILKMIGIPEMIAKDEEDYIALAARMGIDTVFREEMIAKVKANKMRAFNDRSVIRALEKFLISRFPKG